MDGSTADFEATGNLIRIAPNRRPPTLIFQAFSVPNGPLLRLRSLSVFCFLWIRLPQVAQYFCRLELGVNAAPQTAQRWLLFGGIALLVLGFLVSVTFYRCPHCHRVLPANRGKMDDCPYCKLPLRDTK